MLTVKIQSEYSCMVTHNNAQEGNLQRVLKTRVLTAETVDVDMMSKSWIVTCNKDTFYDVPFFHKEEQWREDDGVTVAIYIENERGKTVHSIRSQDITADHGIGQAVG